MADETLLTQEGYDRLKAELDELVTKERMEVAERIKEARAYGDISENAEYDAAKNEQAELEERINKLEAMLRQAKIIGDEKTARGKVSIGSKVTVREGKKKAELEYIIVGATEADPFEGKISNESAVGGALIDHKVGDVVDVDAPGGKVRYEILKINKWKG